MKRRITSLLALVAFALAAVATAASANATRASRLVIRRFISYLLSVEERGRRQEVCRTNRPVLEGWVRHRPVRRPGSPPRRHTVAGQRRVLTGLRCSDR